MTDSKNNTGVDNSGDRNSGDRNSTNRSAVSYFTAINVPRKFMNKEEKQRTSAQNRALHSGFQEIADRFNEKGYGVEQVLEIMNWGIELSWTKTLVKEVLFKQIEKIMFDKTSTADLTTKEPQEVWENMSRGIAPTGVYVPFPSIEGEMLDDLIKNYEN